MDVSCFSVNRGPGERILWSLHSRHWRQRIRTFVKERNSKAGEKLSLFDQLSFVAPNRAAGRDRFFSGLSRYGVIAGDGVPV
jgi:hypothetical protein